MFVFFILFLSPSVNRVWRKVVTNDGILVVPDLVLLRAGEGNLGVNLRLRLSDEIL